jgi:hypothetical protein
LNDFKLGTPTDRYSATTPVLCSGCIAPLISASPTNLTVTSGASAAFSVSAAGTAPAYQWRKDGVAIVGATLSTLSLNPASTNDAGGYDVVVTNACGSVTSAVAILTVTADPPLITSDPEDQTANLGAAAVFSVSATGSLPLTFQWRKAGSPLAGATNQMFAIASVTTNDFGSYDVVVSNAFGTLASLSANLTPAPTNQPPATPAISGITLNADRSVTMFFHGGTGETYRVLAATNLVPGAWLPVSTNVADADGNWTLTDFAPTNLPQRFYRAVAP